MQQCGARGCVSQAPEWFVYDGTRRLPYLLVSSWHYSEGREAGFFDKDRLRPYNPLLLGSEIMRESISTRTLFRFYCR